jgi:ABC-type multidrug transport system fused ATPase/permease subunit
MKPARAFQDQESSFQGRFGSSVFDTIAQAYRPFLARTLILLLIGFIGRLLVLANVNLLGYWVDSSCKGSECRPAPWGIADFTANDYLVGLLGLTIVGSLLHLVFRVGFSRLSAHAISQVYDETTLRTSRFPMSFFDRNPAGRVITRFASDYNNAFRIFGGPLSEFFSLVFDLIAMAILLGIASPWYLLVAAAIASLNFALYRLNIPRLRIERRAVSAKRSPGIAHFSETARGGSTIRAYGRQANFHARFHALNEQYLRQRLRTAGFVSLFAGQMGAMSALIFLVTALASVALLSQGALTLGAVGVAFTYIGLSTAVLQAFFDWLSQFEEALTGMERLDQYLRTPLERGAALPSNARFQTGHRRTTEALPAPGPTPALELEVRDLWFRYREDLPPVLQGLNFKLRAGERVALIGKTGSGKSSLIQALYHLYPIERGEILLQGQVMNPQSDGPDGLYAWRRRISLIAQDPILFRGTLKENLTPVGRFEDARLIEALLQVQFIPAPPTRDEALTLLASPIEDRGQNLSLGERQLLCMARCILQETGVVILDEATSSIDPATEELLGKQMALAFRGKTQLVVAHRLSTIADCDRVLWLEDGKLFREGHPNEILSAFTHASRERSSAEYP